MCIRDRILLQLPDEQPLEFEHVNRQREDVVDARIAGAEFVEHEFNLHVGQFLHDNVHPRERRCV